jgi:hypothetical protein
MTIKKILILGAILILTLGCLTGCMESYTSFDIDESGMADVTFVLVADKIMAGEESNVISYGLRSSIIELQKNYTHHQDVRRVNYTNYTYQIFESKEPVDISQHEFIDFTKNEDGSYRFVMEIPKLVEETSEEDKDTLMFTVNIKLPKDIDMANTTETDNNEATWYIYKNNLAKGLTLKAITK